MTDANIGIFQKIRGIIHCKQCLAPDDFLQFPVQSGCEAPVIQPTYKYGLLLRCFAGTANLLPAPVGRTGTRMVHVDQVEIIGPFGIGTDFKLARPADPDLRVFAQYTFDFHAILAQFLAQTDCDLAFDQIGVFLRDNDGFCGKIRKGGDQQRSEQTETKTANGITQPE